MKKILLIPLMLVTCLGAQEIAVLQNDYQQMLGHLQRRQLTADSVQTRLKQLSDEIERIKKGPEDKQTRLPQLLARALEIGMDVEARYKNIHLLQKQLLKIRAKLYGYYTRRINVLRDSVNTPARGNPELEAALRERSRYAPLPRFFSFDPRVIDAMPGDSGASALDARIHKDFLQRALTEVDSNLTIVKKRRRDVHDRQLLRREMAAFSNQMEEETLWPQNTGSAADKVFEDPGRSDLATSAGIRHNDVYQSGMPLFERWLSTEGALPDSLSTEDYQNMLLDAENYLNHLRVKIVHKLGRN